MPHPHPFVSGIMTEKWYTSSKSDQYRAAKRQHLGALYAKYVPDIEKKGSFFDTLDSDEVKALVDLYCKALDAHENRAGFKDNLSSILECFAQGSVIRSSDVLACFKLKLLIRDLCLSDQIEAASRERLEKVLCGMFAMSVGPESVLLVPKDFALDCPEDVKMLVVGELLDTLENFHFRCMAGDLAKATKKTDELCDLFDFLEKKMGKESKEDSSSELIIQQAKLFFHYHSTRYTENLSDYLFTYRCNLLEELSANFTKDKRMLDRKYLISRLMRFEVHQHGFHDAPWEEIDAPVEDIEEGLRQEISDYLKKHLQAVFTEYSQNAFPLLVQKIESITTDFFQALFIDLKEWDRQTLELSADSFKAFQQGMLAVLPFSEQDFEQFLDQEFMSEAEEKEEEKTYAIKKRGEFYFIFEKFLENYLLAQGYYVLFERDFDLLQEQLASHSSSLLKHPSPLLKLIEEDPAIWTLLPPEIKTNPDFVLLAIGSLNKIFEHHEHGAEALRPLMSSIERLVEENPACLERIEDLCLKARESQVSQDPVEDQNSLRQWKSWAEKLLKKNGFLWGRLPAFLREDPDLIDCAKKQNLYAMAGFSSDLWERQSTQTFVQDYIGLRKSLGALQEAFEPAHTYFSHSMESDPQSRMPKFIWKRRPGSSNRFINNIEQMQVTKALIQDEKISLQQVKKYAKKITPTLLGKIAHYRKAQGFSPLPACDERVLEQFKLSLLPLFAAPVFHEGMEKEEILQGFERYWQQTSLDLMKQDAQTVLREGRPLTLEQRLAIEQFLKAPDWISAYFHNRHYSPYSPFEEWEELWWQLQDLIQRVALLCQTTVYLIFRLGILLLASALFCAYFMTVASLVVSVALGTLGLFLNLITFAYPQLVFMTTFLMYALIWVKDLFDYRSFSYFNEIVLPTVSLCMLSVCGLLVGFLAVFYLMEVLSITSPSLMLLLVMLTSLSMVGSFLFLKDLFTNWRLYGAPDRTSILDYCYRVVSTLPALLSLVFMADNLLFGVCSIIVAGLLACAVLVRVSSRIENFFYLNMRSLESALYTVVSEAFYIPQITNLLVRYALETWKIAHFAEWNIFFPLFSRSYETLLQKIVSLCSESLDLAEVCENCINRLELMQENAAAQEKAALLTTIWECIQKERIGQEPPKEAAEALPAAIPLKDLLRKKYPEANNLSFFEVANARRTFSGKLDLQSGAGFFSSSRTKTINSLQEAMLRVEAAEPSPIN